MQMQSFYHFGVILGVPMMTDRMNTVSLLSDVHLGSFPTKCTTHAGGILKMNRSTARIGYARVSTVDRNLDA